MTTVILPQARSFTVLSPNDPALIPSGDYRLAGAASLPSGLTYGRPSQAWDYEFNVYANDVPRLTATGLLYEAAEVNPVVRSSAFDDAAWVKSGVGPATVIADQATAPDGTLTADELGGSDVNDTVLQPAIDCSANTTYVAALYIKNVDATEIWLVVRDQTNGADVVFTAIDVSGSTPIVSSLTAPGAYIAVSSSIHPAPQGFWRVVLIVTTDADASQLKYEIRPTRGTAGRSIYAAFAGLREGAQQASPIPTNASAVTRAAGNLNVALADGNHDVLVERPDLDGVVVTKSFVDVTATGGAGWTVPIDMDMPYVSRIRHWPDGRLTAGHKSFLTA